METLRLTIYERPADWLGFIPYRLTRFDADGNTLSDSYASITPERAATLPIQEVLTDGAAKSKLWDIDFEEHLTAIEQKATLAVFPDLNERDKTKLKSPRDIRTIAYKKIKKQFGVTCPRCGGSGSYAKSVAWTIYCDGVCLKCGGSGIALPRLTDKKIAEIKEFFRGAK